MVKVSVKAEGGRYSTLLEYDSGYRYVGEEFEAGEPVDGRFAGERKAERDATDWRVKLTQAGLQVV